MKSERTVLMDNEPKYTGKCFSWSAIFAGVFVGLGLTFLLNLFGIAIGLSAYSTAADGSKAFAFGGFIGLVLVTVIAMYLSGMVTGYLARPHCFRKHLATVYGFTTWSVMLLVTMMLASHVGNFVNYSTTRISNPTVVKFTSDQNAPVAADSSTASTDSTTVNTEKATNLLGTAAFITFFLFALGAIFCCLGVHHGLCCKRDDGVEIR